MMSGPADATKRLRRLLSLVPWVASHPYGVALAEVCERFGMSEEQLVDDLNVVSVAGVYPYTPDVLIEAMFDSEWVTIRLADYFARPLRLTPAEGLALVASASALGELPGFDASDALNTAIEKLSAVVGASVDATDAVDIDLGRTSDETYLALVGARDAQEQVVIDYYSAESDTRSERVIEPAAVWNADGQWYVSGFCYEAQDTRTFRIDRVASVQATGVEFMQEPDRETTGFAFNFKELPEAELLVDPQATWLFDHMPVQSREIDNTGWVRFRIAVSSKRWLERILVQLGPQVKVQNIDARLGGDNLGREAAARVLDRYRGNDMSQR